MYKKIIHFFTFHLFTHLFRLRGRHCSSIEIGHNILIGVSSGIGDALMAEPLVRALKMAKPDMKVGMLASEPTAALFQNNSWVDHIFILKLSFYRIISLILQIHKRRYSLYIGAIPSNTLSQVFIPIIAGIPFRLKHRSPHAGSQNYDFLFHRIEPIPEGRHRMVCNLDLLKYVGITNIQAEIKPQIHVSDESIQHAKQMLQKKGFDDKKLTIGFHPGCNPKAAFKRWAPENYAQLMKYLFDEWHAQILLVGGKDEKEDVRKIELLLTRTAFNFVGQADLFETAALIKHCRFFVSNDSGIMHLATAVDVPVFAIFGPKDERHIGPYGFKHTVIRNGKEVNNVTVEKVINTLLQSEHGLKGIPV